MTPDTVVDIGRQALVVTILLAAPMLLSALLTGLIVGLFQAATQIQEQTLCFIPKLLVMFIALLVSGPFLLQVIIDFTQDLVVNTIPRILGA